MKYYEMHDYVYSLIKKSGSISWDGEKDLSNFFNYEVNNLLKEYVSKYLKNLDRKKSLDLGTGTGTCALYLASLGCDATGYDISEIAINMAKENSKALKINATFEVRDLCTDPVCEKFDLITDSSLLHCIIWDDERKKLLQSIYSSLSDTGYLFVHTMIDTEDLSKMIESPHLELKDGIIWSTGKDEWDMDWTMINGKRCFPHRRMMTKENLTLEFKEVGFQVVSEQIVDEGEGYSNTYVGLLKKI